MDSAPLLPYEEQFVLLHYREPLQGEYYPGTPPRPRRYRHHVECRRRRHVEDYLERFPKAHAFYATARPVCPFTFDWPALAGLIQLARGPVSDFELAEEFLARERAAGARSPITRADLVHFFRTGRPELVGEGRPHALAATARRQLEALAAALATDAFDNLRAELVALPADAFAYQAAL